MYLLPISLLNLIANILELKKNNSFLKGFFLTVFYNYHRNPAFLFLINELEFTLTFLEKSLKIRFSCAILKLNYSASALPPYYLLSKYNY